MTQALRGAAQALLDAYAEKGPYRHLHISTARVALQDAMTAPQPTADERVAEHMRCVDDFARASTGQFAQSAKAMRETIEASARALLSASKEDAEMLDWLADNEHLLNWGELKYKGLREAIRSAMKEKKE